MQFIYLALSIGMGAIGQLLLKIGMNKIGDFSLTLPGIMKTLFSPVIFIGLMLFGSSFVLWLKVLTQNDLSNVYPLVSINYIVIALLSWLILNETFTAPKLAGIGIIIIGVVVMNWR